MTGGWLLVASLTCGAAACFLAAHLFRHRLGEPWPRWDSTEAEVAALPAVLRSVALDAVPIVPGAGWRPARPGETPGAAEPDDAPAVQPVVARSPLLRVSHRGDETAATPAGYQPRHLSYGVRDPLLDALLTTTAVFEAIAEHEGAPVHEHGPREIECRRVSWHQATLELGALTRG